MVQRVLVKVVEKRGTTARTPRRSEYQKEEPLPVICAALGLATGVLTLEVLFR